MKNIVRYIGFCLLYLVLSLSMSAQSTLTDSISTRFLQQLLLFPQEKLYLHTDKPAYVAGDTIWFRAHVVDAASHVPVSVSRYVYVELTDIEDSIVCRVKVRHNDSVYSGYLPLPLTMQQNNYRLRAYTSFMKSLPQDCLFDINLQVYNPLIHGDGICRKVIDNDDSQENADISLLDIVCNAGYLYISPVAEITDRLRAGEKMFLVLHCRGSVLFAEIWKKGQERYVFDMNSFPVGVTQVLLLNNQLVPLSQQLVFGGEKECLNMDFVTDKVYYGHRERVKCQIRLADDTGRPLKGRFSVSVTNDAYVQTDSICMLDTYLLWKSDWFDNGKDWLRYNVPQLLQGEYQRPFYPIEDSQVVEGVTRDFYNHKIKPKTELSLFAVGYLYEKRLQSDSLGRFRFNGFEFPEGTSYLIRTEGKRGSKTIQAIVEPELFYPFHTDKKRIHISSEMPFVYSNEYRERFDSLRQMLNGYQLDEVVVEADSVPKVGKSVFHSLMGQVKTSKELMIPRPRTLADMLGRFPGVYVSGNDSIGVVVRGCTNPIILLDDILVPYSSVQNINVDEIDEIEIIKDASAAMFGMKGANGAILIMTKRGEETKPVPVRNVIRLMPLGYQQTRLFDAFRYDTNEKIASLVEDNRTTLYWNPSITISNDDDASFDFYTPDNDLPCTVLVQGVTDDGRILSLKKTVLIKE